MIVITGSHSQIAREFCGLLPPEEAVYPAKVDGFIPHRPHRFLFCSGLLRSKRFHEQSMDEVLEGYHVNCGAVVAACTTILEDNPVARICIIGSESGYRGSYDGTYAAAKADLHGFIEETPVGPRQQLVGISPGIIGDAGMTARRSDTDNLERRRAEHPKGRFLTSAEVARVAYFALYEASDYLTNHVIRMHGGLR